MSALWWIGISSASYSNSLAAVCPRDSEGAPRIVGQDSCAISRPYSALGLTRETCQMRWKEERERGREPCWQGEGEKGELCQPVSLPPSSSWAWLPRVLDWAALGEHGRRTVRAERRGGSGQVFRPQPPGWTGTSSRQQCYMTFL